MEKRNSVGGTVWWNSFSGTVMLEQCRWNTKVEQWTSLGAEGHSDLPNLFNTIKILGP